MSVPYSQRNIDTFKTRLAGGGARPNLFEVALQFPAIEAIGVNATGGNGLGPAEESRFMVKAAELPASNIGDIPVNFRGRILHVAGDRTFDPWTVTVINNTDWSLRGTFENWSNYINNRVYDTGVTNPRSYHSTAEVLQLNRNTAKEGTANPTGGANIGVAAKYKFYGIWPSQVSSIALDYGSTDTIEEFQVTFQVEYWNAVDPKWETKEGG